MNDMTLSVNLATRAKRLTALSRAKRDNLDKSQAQGQVQTALNRLDLGLGNLGGALKVHRKLKETGVPVTDPVGLEKPAKSLKQEAALGRPTAQFLQVRARGVEASCSAIDTESNSAWQTWAAARIEGLPLALLPRVHFSRRGTTQKRIFAMRALAGKKPNIPDIIQFQQWHGSVKEELGEVGDASIDSLLGRFSAGRILLADLSDAELEMLREDDSLSDQIYLHIGS